MSGLIVSVTLISVDTPVGDPVGNEAVRAVWPVKPIVFECCTLWPVIQVLACFCAANRGFVAFFHIVCLLVFVCSSVNQISIYLCA